MVCLLFVPEIKFRKNHLKRNNNVSDFRLWNIYLHFVTYFFGHNKPDLLNFINHFQ